MILCQLDTIQTLTQIIQEHLSVFHWKYMIMIKHYIHLCPLSAWRLVVLLLLISKYPSLRWSSTCISAYISEATKRHKDKHYGTTMLPRDLDLSKISPNQCKISRFTPKMYGEGRWSWFFELGKSAETGRFVSRSRNGSSAVKHDGPTARPWAPAGRIWARYQVTTH